MILITGATGNFGKATIDFLLKKNIPAGNIAALVRDTSKAEDLKNRGINIRVGDYDNYAGLVDAFNGIDKLLMISSNDLVKRGKQHENVVKAAKEAGVIHIIFTSFERNNETETSPIFMLATTYIETEKLIKSSGITYTIMRNSLYAEVLPMFMGEKVLETGIFLPAGDGKTAFTTRLNMAEAAANILTSDGHNNKEYVIANESNYSFNDVTSLLSEISGKQINYISPEKEVFKDSLSKAGVPMELVTMVAAFCEAIKQGEFSNTGNDLGKLLGRKPTTLKEYLQSVYANN
jgi:NAD(P)H dehydrogenase (quinone)